MIKIEPYFAIDATQVRSLLQHQEESMIEESSCGEESLFKGGLTFWQHWTPCRWHRAPSTYLAKEDGVAVGLISLTSLGKSHTCWFIDHLLVHPDHRGRGIAQELLRYVFALFGSQGVSHFVVEVSAQNQAAHSLLVPCGFRRSAKIVTFQVPLGYQSNLVGSAPAPYRLALSQDKQALYELQQDVLPPDLRIVYDLKADDFSVSDLPVSDLPIYSNDKILKRLIRRKVWYWVSEDKDRKVLTSAIKVKCHREGDYHLEFLVHPGWAHMAKEAVSFMLTNMDKIGMTGIIAAKSYDYQSAVVEALEQANLQKRGERFLMAREHWLRAKTAKRIKLDPAVGLPTMGKPAINLPFNSSKR
jgi:GNAT superfamily N-acetyltransferase